MRYWIGGKYADWFQFSDPNKDVLQLVSSPFNAKFIISDDTFKLVLV